MFDFIRKWFRPRLPEGEVYLEDTASGRLYKALWKSCPGCGLKPPQWMEGPSGGACTNVFCGKCGAGYNITPMVEVAEKIHNDDRYILKEFR